MTTAAAKVARLHPVAEQSLALGDGARAEVKDGGLELFDAAGRLLVRYRDGNAEIFAPAGDLTLAAPNGRVVVRAASDVSIEAEGRVDVKAHTLSQRVEQYELHAGRLIEKARDAFRDVSGLLQTRVGRARSVVEDVYALYTRRTVMVSKHETSVDGERILLG